MFDLDVIIPIYNEESILKSRHQYFKDLSSKTRLVFVDGGSTDRSFELASQFGNVYISKLGRAYQKNLGAREACGRYLLFLHIDTIVPGETLSAINDAFKDGVPAGCMTMCIDDKRGIFRWYESVVNFRAKDSKIIDGDLGTFIHKSVFEQLKGFDELPIMEDILFSQRLRESVNVVQLPNKIYVSSRRWHEKGFLKTFGEYTLAYIQLWTGIPFFKDKSIHEKRPQKSPRYIWQRT